jgi:hypothetical protein
MEANLALHRWYQGDLDKAKQQATEASAKTAAA